MTALDSNVVLRYLIGDDERQFALARELIENSLTPENQGFVSVVTVAEIAWVMRRTYKLPIDVVVDAVELLLASPRLRVECQAVVSRAISAVRDDGGEFGDALISMLGLRAGCTATVTFDRDAAKRIPGFALLR